MTRMPFLKPLLTISLVICLSASFGGAAAMNGSSSETEASAAAEPAAERSGLQRIWTSSGLIDTDISLEAFSHALTGYRQIRSTMGDAVGSHLVIIDYSRPSDRDRMVVYNVIDNKVEFSSLVSHGRNSGENMATSFSNRIQSYQSSLGFYLTAETYFGKHGYSLRLDGLEYGFNDNARERAIVMHGADYATKSFVDQHGRLGRSLGCPSLPPDVSAKIIDRIKGNNVLFIFAQEDDYLAGSSILNESFALNGE